jgi:hypothetical protein
MGICHHEQKSWFSKLKINHVGDARATCVKFFGSVLVVAKQEDVRGLVRGMDRKTKSLHDF